MTPAPKTREWPVPTLLALATLAAMLGGGIVKAVDWMGGDLVAPTVRLAKMEHYDSARKVVVDSMFRASEARIEDLGDRVDNLTDLTLMLVSMQCLNPNLRSAAQQARVPCARVLREQGIAP